MKEDIEQVYPVPKMNDIVSICGDHVVDKHGHAWEKAAVRTFAQLGGSWEVLLNPDGSIGSIRPKQSKSSKHQ